jgi:hypothetical protein
VTDDRLANPDGQPESPHSTSFLSSSSSRFLTADHNKTSVQSLNPGTRHHRRSVNERQAGMYVVLGMADASRGVIDTVSVVP